MTEQTEIVVEPGRQEILITRIFDAPRDLVFAAFTDPDLIPDWWGPARLRTVVDRMGDARPEVLEAVVAEVMQAIGTGEAAADLVEVGPGIDYCQACLEQDRARTRHRAVLTTTGRNCKGIVARVTAKIADLGGDILDISQTLVGDYFTMIVVIDAATLDVPFADFKSAMEHEVQAMGLQAMMMHEDVVNSLHRV